MNYAKLSCIEFYCYLQQCLSIDLFSYRTPGLDQKGPMNEVCLSFCLEVFLELAFQFFLELSMVSGAHVVLCMTGPYFLKLMFCPPKIGFFKHTGTFSYIGVGMVINGCAHSGHKTLKFAVSHEEINGINWFLVH